MFPKEPYQFMLEGLKKTGPEIVLTEFKEEQLVEWLGVLSYLGDPKIGMI